MKLIEVTGKQKARSYVNLITNVENGKFTKDGKDIKPIARQGFFCAGLHMISLEGCPQVIGGDFDCCNNQLHSFEGGPREVGKDCYAYENKFTSLEGCPEKIGGDFLCSNNKLTSLKDIHKYLKNMDGHFYAYDNPIESHVLGLLKIPGCRRIQLDNKVVQAILNKYLPLGDLLDCQEELIEAGFEEYAQL